MKKTSVGLVDRDSEYAGNLGFQELMAFWGLATPQQASLMTKLLDQDKIRQAWALLKKVTKTNLVDPAPVRAAIVAEVVDNHGLPDGFLEGSRYKEPLFHGTNRKVSLGFGLRPDMGSEYGIFLSPRHRYARLYGGNLYTVFVKVLRPLVVADKSEISPVDLTEDDIRRLENEGYDSIVSGEHEVVLFRSDQAFVWS